MTGVTEMGFILESATPNELVAYQAGANEKWDYVDKLRAEIERRDAVLRLALGALDSLYTMQGMCETAKHAPEDRHDFGDPCPVVERYILAIKAIQEVLG